MTTYDLPDSPVAEAILRTLIYANVFGFPLTEVEIHHFLIGASATPAEVHESLWHSAWLAEHIECLNGDMGSYWAVRGHSVSAEVRLAHDAASAALWPHAERYGRILARLPFVRMVALTGALAVRNASNAHDDIDYLIVTTPRRVWLARLLVVMVVRVARLRGVWLCPNYVLAETALAQDRHDLYMAHELAQMIPLAGHDVYYAMRAANEWSARLMPNARQPLYAGLDSRPHGVGRLVQRIGEALLSGPHGNLLERWEQRRKQRKFEAEALRHRQNAAQLDEERVKGHFNDRGAPIMEKYQAGLRAHALPLNDWFATHESAEPVCSGK